MPDTVQNLIGPMRALFAALEERDVYTAGHSDRTGALATELGRICGLEARELDVLHGAASVHDIGKIGIPDSILLKRARLTPAEWEVMRSHPERGARLLSSVASDAMDEIAVVVRHHHEAFDGSGYPQGLAGDAIPLLSRIISLADCYDAMATTRPYHQPKSHERIMEVLYGENDHLYDPWLRQKFTQLIETSPYRADRYQVQ